MANQNINSRGALGSWSTPVYNNPDCPEMVKLYEEWVQSAGTTTFEDTFNKMRQHQETCTVCAARVKEMKCHS